MADITNDIDALLRALDPKRFGGIIHTADLKRHHASLTAFIEERNALKVQCDKRFDFQKIKDLIAERNALQEENNALRSRCKAHQDEEADRVWEMVELRNRVAELEAQPPASSNLRERLVCAALEGACSQDGWVSQEAIADHVVGIANATLAAMRKGDK